MDDLGGEPVQEERVTMLCMINKGPIKQGVDQVPRLPFFVRVRGEGSDSVEVVRSARDHGRRGTTVEVSGNSRYPDRCTQGYRVS